MTKPRSMIRASSYEEICLVHTEREDDNHRTAMGGARTLFAQAVAYRKSALILSSIDALEPSISQPIRNLYFHAIDLFLKSHLSFNGHSMDEINGKLRSNFRRIRKLAGRYGLKFAGRDRMTIEYFISTPLAVRNRYTSTEYYSAPSLDDLNALCESLEHSIASQIGEHAPPPVDSPR